MKTRTQLKAEFQSYTIQRREFFKMPMKPEIQRVKCVILGVVWLAEYVHIQGQDINLIRFKPTNLSTPAEGETVCDLNVKDNQVTSLVIRKFGVHPDDREPITLNILNPRQLFTY